jgi:16S rRNA (guanine(966)-N(2))-methyltransferase RsmD
MLHDLVQINMTTPRIIAGKARGIRLKDVPGDTTRPITDRVKEALFNIIGSDIIGATFLDLFGGTGSVGIEAISRGANQTTFIEINHLANKIIKDNLLLAHCSDQAIVKLQDAFRYLRQPLITPFSYIFIAPPQYKNLWQKAIEIIDLRPEWLEEDGSMIIQIDPVEYLNLNLQNFREYESRKYGSTQLLFFEKIV